jgi:hypothetical protein
MAMNSHARLSGISLAGIHLTGHTSHMIGCTSPGACTLGVHLTKRVPYGYTLHRYAPCERVS